jgi:hypothetical protein
MRHHAFFRGSGGFVLFVGLAIAIPSGSVQSQGKKGIGKGKADPTMKADMEVFHFLLDNRKDIQRTVKNIDDGVETITESNVPEIASKIKDHVAAMHERIKAGKGIHLRDPLFAEIFEHTDKIQMVIEKTDKGVRVKETAKDAHVVRLIQAHAEVVSKFIKNGHAEMRTDHPIPAAPKK